MLVGPTEITDDDLDGLCDTNGGTGKMLRKF